MSHEVKVSALQIALKQNSQKNSLISFKRSSSNSTRPRPAFASGTELDLTDLDEIVSISPIEKHTDVEPGVPMDRLVAETLKYNLIPLVVPEFPGITVGGAIQGGSLESSSYKHGQFNDMVLEYELLLSDGRKIIATPNNEHSDLFFGVATSYGSIALITRVRLRLGIAKKYVSITIQPYYSSMSLTDAIFEETRKAEVDFIEGILFSQTLGAVITGKMTDLTDNPVKRFGRNFDTWYYHFTKHVTNMDGGKFIVPLVDYLFRYDKGAFWMGEYLFSIFYLSSNSVTRFLFAPFLRARKLYDGLHAFNIQHEYFIQDFYLNGSSVNDFLELNSNGAKIYPVWLCPIKATTMPQKLSSHYRNSEQMLLNVGIYGKPATHSAIDTTLEFERHILNTHDRKMLYAHTFWTEQEFWQKYDHVWYTNLRKKYGARLFKDVWSKVYTFRSSKTRKFLGTLQIFIESIRGKNVVWK